MNRSQTNTWRAIQDLEPLKPMEDIVAELKTYIDTYDKQLGYEEYPDTMFIDDILYGLGASIDPKYKFAQGFGAFKELLLKNLLADDDLKFYMKRKKEDEQTS